MYSGACLKKIMDVYEEPGNDSIDTSDGETFTCKDDGGSRIKDKKKLLKRNNKFIEDSEDSDTISFSFRKSEQKKIKVKEKPIKTEVKEEPPLSPIDTREMERKHEKEALELARRSRKMGCKTSSVEKMAEYTLSQRIKLEDGEYRSSRLNNKNTEIKKPGEDMFQPKIVQFFNKANSAKKGHLCFSYTADIEELLRLPDRPKDGSKTEDEIIDDLEAEISRKQQNLEEEIAKDLLKLEGGHRKLEEWKIRCKKNGLLRIRLEQELTEEKLREMFKENLAYLKGVEEGKVSSSRHQAFYKSVKARHGLYYTMITHPFNDQQLDWTLEEMSQVWMRTKKERMDNSKYVWKVLLPECFIKFYMDWFKVKKTEAELMIKETPIDEGIEDGGE